MAGVWRPGGLVIASRPSRHRADVVSEPFPVTVRNSVWSCGAAVFDVQQDEGGGGDGADDVG